MRKYLMAIAAATIAMPALASGPLSVESSMLTLRKRTGIKTQNPAEQSRVKAADRLRIVKMDVEKPAPAVAPPPTTATGPTNPGTGNGNGRGRGNGPKPPPNRSSSIG